MRRSKEIRLWQEGKLVAGVDEAGRGPLAGPVVACAIILKPFVKIKGIKDSKLLSPKRREELYRTIKEKALTIGIARVGPKLIDRINIHQATLLAMKRAITKLNPKPDLVIVDGNSTPKITLPIQSVVGADRKIFSCACAAIVAKVERDRMMERYDKIYSGYEFSVHKGYGTKRHQERLIKYGPCPIHRRSFAPLSERRDAK